MPRHTDRCGDPPAGWARERALPAAWAVAVTIVALAVAAVVCDPAAAWVLAEKAENFDPTGSRWIAYLVVGGTLVVSGGGYLYLRFFSKDHHDDEDEEDTEEPPVVREDDRVG